MNTIDSPPDIPNAQHPQGGYPSKGRRIGPAWREVWAALTAASDWLDGCKLAESVAPKHDLAPATVLVLVSRAAKAGVLERTHRTVMGPRGPRPRTHYRIPPS